ncbi:hypothetical protein ABN034_21415 [Actinopolymorpha sp. B11F2]|uniref:hypothetical protein n=1 Tax=Actinopolymorpha sp. B11F2 TaxID=3160862 RepID=UPI0032E41F7E
MSGGFEFQPVANGMDFLQSAIRHLEDAEEPTSLKYAVLHLHAAAEVLLKVRLMREHWALVFRDPGSAKRDALRQGDFQSVGIDETIVRLRGTASVELDKSAIDHLKRLGKERNKLQHFGFEGNQYAIESIAGQALDSLLHFVVDHLVPDAPNDETEILKEVRELIEGALENIESLVEARWERITPRLESCADEVIACPQCTNMALWLSDNDFTCFFCDKHWGDVDPYEVASEYAGNILNGSQHLAAKGRGYWPVYTCPECDQEAFVSGMVLRSERDTEAYACFSCKLITSSDRLSTCSDCGRYMLVASQEQEDYDPFCSSCWEYRIGKD